MARETLIIETLIDLADNLVDNYDVIDVLTLLSDRCTEALDVDATGVMLASPSGELQFVASSSESMRILELFQIQTEEGPCVDSYHRGEPVIVDSLYETNERWPRFAPAALAHGFQSVHSLPMKLRGRTIGALNLFRSEPGMLGAEDVYLAQGLAHVATIAILQHRTALDASTLNAQLGYALNSRIIIEQAKGMVAQTMNVDMDHAFATIRGYSRDHNVGLTIVASQIVERELSSATIATPRPKFAHARTVTRL
ncbi:MAG TPA: GAF and ANTAR domain-containing protein [Acidimicrobiales bacterium]|jgi:GAF domain-containing protein